MSAIRPPMNAGPMLRIGSPPIARVTGSMSFRSSIVHNLARTIPTGLLGCQPDPVAPTGRVGRHVFTSPVGGRRAHVLAGCPRGRHVGRVHGGPGGGAPTPVVRRVRPRPRRRVPVEVRPRRRPTLPVVGLDRCDGVGPAQPEGVVDAPGDPDVPVRSARDRLIEPDPLHEGRMLHESEQRRRRRHHAASCLQLREVVQRVVQRDPILVDELVDASAVLVDPVARVVHGITRGVAGRTIDRVSRVGVRAGGLWRGTGTTPRERVPSSLRRVPLDPTLRALALATKGFMPADEGDALHAAALAAAACGAGCAVGRGRFVLRSIDDLARRRRTHRRRDAVRGRPSPRVGGEPVGLGAPRRRGRRPADGRDGHVAVLPAGDPRRRAGGRRSWRSSVGHPTSRGMVDAARRSCSSTAGTASSRPEPTTRGGRPTSRPAARSRSTTCSPIRPTAAARRTSRSICPAIASGRFELASVTGSLRIAHAGRLSGRLRGDRSDRRRSPAGDRRRTPTAVP